MTAKSLSITFSITNQDRTDLEFLEPRKTAMADALNELSFPEDGSKPVNQLGVHGASVHIAFDHKRRHAVIDIRGDQCTGACTVGTVASAQTIHAHFASVVVPNNIIQTFSVSVGGTDLDELKRRYAPTSPAVTPEKKRFSIFGR